MPKFKEEKADDKQISTILFKHAHVIYIYDIYIYVFNGVLYLHWACIQQVMYTTGCLCLRRTLTWGCLCLHKVTCLYVCHFVTPENLNTRLDECRFVTPEDLNMRLDACRFMTPEDLKHVPRRVSFYDTGGL
ncbi:hypothetical protein Taro_007380 [Colocasia esculenta]|uniref:Uncharacterized protein n=1 Tax=Colocasia esculenta TaxID=4460 RepID=A0A843TY09_COLES|nr:hypothetical protein [Colocasia esculenta]